MKFPAVLFKYPRTDPIAGFYDVESETAFGIKFECGFRCIEGRYKPVFKFNIIDWEVVYRATSLYADTIIVVVVDDGFCTIVRPSCVMKLGRNGEVLDSYRLTIPIYTIPDSIYPAGYVKTRLRVFDVYQPPTILWYNVDDSTLYYKNKFLKIEEDLIVCRDKLVYRDILVTQGVFDSIVMKENNETHLFNIDDLK